MTNPSKKKEGIGEKIVTYTFGGAGCLLWFVAMLFIVLIIVSGLISGLYELWQDILTLLPVVVVITVIWLIVRAIKKR